MRELLSKLVAMFGGRRGIITDLDEEIQAHLEFEIEENRARGMDADEAVRAARQAIGNTTLIAESARNAWVFRFEEIVSDLGFALRMLRKAPVFAVVAIFTLGIGIGANTAIFSVVHAVLLKPLEYREPDRLVRISVDNLRQGYKDVGFTLARYQQLEAAARSFSQISAYFIASEHMTLSGVGQPEQVTAARVSANFLDVLGMKPVLGRGFLPAEDRRGGPSVALISAELWSRRFGRDPMITAKTIDLNAIPYSVVGVLPKGFAFPAPAIDIWVTRPAEYSEIVPQFWDGLTVLIGLGRLKPGVTLPQARSELSVLNRQYTLAHPEMADADPGVMMRIGFLRDQLVENARSMLWILFGAVAFVLLIACANVASILLARAASRSHEFAVRSALGAARPRLIRQLLAESILLAGIGGCLGVLFANLSLKALIRLPAFRLPRAAEIHLDISVLAFTVLVSIATGIFFGLFPSLQLSRPALNEQLRDRAQSGAGTPVYPGIFRVSTRSLLVIAQVALSVTLLIAATLLMKSFIRLHDVNPGFQANNLLTMRIDLPPARYNTPQKKEAFSNELLSRVRTIPGIRSATGVLTLPMSPRNATGVQVVGQPAVSVGERPAAQLQSVTPGYFRTAGIPLRRGREFTDHDNAIGAPLTLIINEAMARRFWPKYPRGVDPIGQRVLIGNNTTNPFEVVGIAANVHEHGLASESIPELYLPTHSYPLQSIGLLVRTADDPLSITNAVCKQVQAIDPDQPVAAVQTMHELLESSIGQQQLTLFLFGGFALMALVLAAVGIYGLIAYSVVQRRQELGIRRALGAQAGDVLGMILRQGLALTLAGLALGYAGALMLTRLMVRLLFQVSALDGTAFAVVGLAFIVVALLASSIPAIRAIRTDPLSALR
ncbi:MAG TPA: ABC transporter permease [Bryobacteraceae bacterium]|jgi:predicted permease|nr:ABC transporter permease [Bryobacteraceae bacterium]